MSAAGAGLSTHVLDTARGRPAPGVRIELHEVTGGERRPVTEATTNADGRTDAPLIGRGHLRPGTFELTFHVGAYYADFPTVSTPPFLDVVTLRFTVADAGAHYHVPLVMTPWSYSTYRGS
ncbi:hydroxyisourate hydrolase [Deinococcus metalli]|uniref:5-hydroxyisourate hydrolase n=1 Tax=Deinococcus metalli TaxID=1141878 RepID=A0A7W8KFD3_9DEIO|nr:hydroxyisourate hydrolase [Deinococcus metalli]MBB5376890.1 hydroxyisourate hydrolase [Deinococcus metalli]GHF46118.1 5-hydroxyisourate hydrolase [Deinococcus metalli]